MGSEVYKHKYFKHYEDYKSVSELIQSQDEAYIYELDDIPTNFPPPKRKVRSLVTNPDTSDEDETAPLAEKLLVPIFSSVKRQTRTRYNQNDLFGVPFFIVLDRDEQMNLDAIYAKIIERYQSQTTTPLMKELNGRNLDEEDEEVVDAEDLSGDEEKKIKEREGEDGYIDVSMEDATTTRDGSPEPEARRKVTRSVSNTLKELFTIMVCKKGFSNDGLVPTGWQNLEPTVDIKSRMRVPNPPPQAVKKSFHPIDRPGRPASDASEDDYDGEEFTNVTQTPAENSDDEENTQSDNMFASFSQNTSQPRLDALEPSNFYGKKPNTLNTSSKHFNTRLAQTPPAEFMQPQLPLIRLSEAVVCEWDEGAFENIFGGTHESHLRGMPLWDKPEFYVDEELEKKKRIRDYRKKKGIHLEDCLDEFAKEEILSETDLWYCPRCKDHRRASKKFELWKCPDILVIHLKRFSSSRSFRDKIDVLIDFPIEKLDLTERVGDEVEGKELLYDLIAVDNHYGGLGGGHYTAYAKNFEDKKWYHFDGWF